MDQDATLYGGRPPPRRHFLDGDLAPRRKGALQPPPTYWVSLKGHPTQQLMSFSLYTVRQKKRNQLVFVWNFVNKSPAVAEMGDRLATIDTGRKVGSGCCVRWVLARSSLGHHLWVTI